MSLESERSAERGTLAAVHLPAEEENDMLTATELKAIGKKLRAEHAGRPKGGIPDRIWQLLLAIEQSELKGK